MLAIYFIVKGVLPVVLTRWSASVIKVGSHAGSE